MFQFSLLSKVIMIFAFITISSGIGATIYFSIKHQAAQVQLLKDQNIQLKGMIEQQEKIIKQTQDIIDLNNDSSKKLEEKLDKINTDFSLVTDFLTSPEAIKSDRPASEILKKVIEELSKGRE